MPGPPGLTRPDTGRPVLRAPRRARAAAAGRRRLQRLGRRLALTPMKATASWWGRHRFALFVTATPACGTAAAAVTWGPGAALAAAAVGCAFMAYMSDDEPQL